MDAKIEKEIVKQQVVLTLSPLEARILRRLVGESTEFDLRETCKHQPDLINYLKEKEFLIQIYRILSNLGI